MRWREKKEKILIIAKLEVIMPHVLLWNGRSTKTNSTIPRKLVVDRCKPPYVPTKASEVIDACYTGVNNFFLIYYIYQKTKFL
jgi:hypothetical protein